MLNFKRIILYSIAHIYNKIFQKKYNIMTIGETINYINENRNSLIRFGDGEFSLMNGKDIKDYQSCSPIIRDKLLTCLKATTQKNVLICMPETLKNMDMCSKKSTINWEINFYRNRKIINLLDKDYLYGNSFVSRPYMIYSDKSKCDIWFSKLISIFDNKKILLIEGEYSRSGVGNDLFSSADSVERILCPPYDAYKSYDRIFNTVKKFDKDRLVLIAIGPTSKPLALDLTKLGYWTIDIGHLDSEYEWYLNKSNKKDVIVGKHTAEHSDKNIENCTDVEYIKSIKYIIK